MSKVSSKGQINGEYFAKFCGLLRICELKQVFILITDVGRGPSAKFQVENVHTAAELKMTGNCLKATRPFLSFDMAFADKDKPHLQLLKELFIQTFGIPKGNDNPRTFY